MADLAGEKFGNYRLVRALGKGGFADVYLGQHIHLDSFVAVKVLFARMMEHEQAEFMQEARLIASLEHPSIVRVLDCGIEHDTAFLVMNYAPHGTLRQRHPKGSRLAISEVLSYTRQVTAALHYAHGRKIIHRDVKPENMLLDARQNVLLSDFGIALISASSTSQSTQAAAGTIFYMAPEQIMGKSRLASDQYALGIVVYEWLCGERPFKGTFSELCAQHLYAPPPSLSTVNPQVTAPVEAVVMKALAKQPQQRFSSIQNFMAALEEAARYERITFSAPQVTVRPDAPGGFDRDVTGGSSSEELVPTIVKPVSDIRHPALKELDSIGNPVTPLPLSGEAVTTDGSTRISSTVREPVSGVFVGGIAPTVLRHSKGRRWIYVFPALILILALITGSLVFALQHLQTPGGPVAQSTTAAASSTTPGGVTQTNSPAAHVSPTAKGRDQSGNTGKTSTTPTAGITPGLTPGISPIARATTPAATQNPTPPTVQPTPPTPIPPTVQPTPPSPTPALVPPAINVSPSSRINDFTNCTWDTHGGVGQDVSCPYVLSNPANANGILNWSVISNNSNVVFSKTNGSLAPGATVTITAFDSSSCPLTDVFTFQGNANQVQATMICTAIYVTPDAMSFDNTYCVNSGNWTCSISVQAPTQNSQDTQWVVTLQNPDPNITFSVSQGTLAPGSSVNVIITIAGSDCPGNNVFLFNVPNTLPVGPNYLNWSC